MNLLHRWFFRKSLTRKPLRANGHRNASPAGLSSLTPAQVLTAVDALARACNGLQVCEAYLGVPEQAAYEVLAGDRKLSARLDPRLLPSLITLFRGARRMTRSCTDESLSPLELSLIPSPVGPVVRLSWRGPAPQAPLRQTLPVETPNQLLRPATELAQDKQSLRALIIDDDDRFSLILGKVLENHGYTVERVRAADKALSALSTQTLRPHVILCDMHMPRMNGLEFVTEFRARHGKEPVLVLTSDDATLLEVQFISGGASAFLRKSEDTRVLLAWCQNLVKSNQ